MFREALHITSFFSNWCLVPWLVLHILIELLSSQLWSTRKTWKKRSGATKRGKRAKRPSSLSRYWASTNPRCTTSNSKGSSSRTLETLNSAHSLKPRRIFFLHALFSFLFHRMLQRRMLGVSFFSKSWCNERSLGNDILESSKPWLRACGSRRPSWAVMHLFASGLEGFLGRCFWSTSSWILANFSCDLRHHQIQCKVDIGLWSGMKLERMAFSFASCNCICDFLILNTPSS